MTLATDYESAKAGLLKGGFVAGARRIGKTTALVDVIAEKHQGDAIVVCLNDVQMDYFLKLYRERHPGVAEPFVMGQNNIGMGRGTNQARNVYADCWSHFLPVNQNRLRSMLMAAVL